MTQVLTSKKTATMISSFRVHSICIESGGPLVDGPRCRHTMGRKKSKVLMLMKKMLRVDMMKPSQPYQLGTSDINISGAR